MAGRYSPPPHPHPERPDSFNPLAHLLQHLADSPPTTPAVFTKVDPEHPATHDPEDILREIRTDGDSPFPIDRNVLRKIVEKKMASEVEAISFLSSGTFHKAFLVTLEDGREIVARIARRYMPRLKTESEVATINYIRQHTDIPVPLVYHFDSNPYNRLGGEYILMSKAPGIPLHRQYHHFSPDTQRKFFTNLARIIITLFSHRFPMIGSLYQHPLHPSPLSRAAPGTSQYKFRVGPIISWPFFGGGRGERNDIPRGPWPSERTYLLACAQREIQEVRREGEGRVQAHRPHLPPEDAESSSEEETGVASLSRIGSAIAIKGGVGPSHIGQQHVGHPHLAGGSIPMSQTNSIASSSLRNQLRRPGNRRHHSHRGAGLTSIVHSVAPSADPSDEEVSSSSDDDVYSYQDYRSHFRSSLLVAHQEARVANVRKDFDTFIQYMTETLGVDDRDEEFREFALDLHDLSTSNIFVDPDDLGRITCIIDWESTVIRPLWQCAHLPSFLASDPNSPEASLFRQIIAEVGSTSPHSQGCVPNGHVEPGVAKSPAPPPTSGPGPAVQSNTPVSSSADVTPPLPLTPKVLQAEAQRWLKGEREREPWRTAHKVVEWDGWEDGLVGMILGNAVGVKLPAETPHNGFVGGVRNDVAMMRFDDY